MGLLLKYLPASIPQWVGYLQSKYPPLRKIIKRLKRFTPQEGVIARGPGAGLHFDAHGSSIGYLAGTTDLLEQQLVAKFSRVGSTVYDVWATCNQSIRR